MKEYLTPNDPFAQSSEAPEEASVSKKKKKSMSLKTSNCEDKTALKLPISHTVSHENYINT